MATDRTWIGYLPGGHGTLDCLRLTDREGLKMASTEPRLPEQYVTAPAHVIPDFHISEFTADMAGSLSPFGQDVQFPLPLDQIHYTPPGPADRPNLADGR